jgi:uroporphyrinogen-III synthase
LADAFGEAGVRVVEVAAYDSRCPEHMAEPAATALADGAVDAIAFTSGKTATHTAQLMEKRFGSEWKQHLNGVAVVSIGPQTSRSCREHFGRVDAEADPHDLEGLVEACTQAIQSKS